MDFEAARIAAQNALANGKFEAAIEAANLLVDAGEPWLPIEPDSTRPIKPRKS